MTQYLVTLPSGRITLHSEIIASRIMQGRNDQNSIYYGARAFELTLNDKGQPDLREICSATWSKSA